ncbi:UDP-D-xylose:L-fucose alpha-1,3-D-xylosyltransferase MGP4-like [Acanthaster planci]|uniref:UDP-D-xylose:L-fucose alpha-1,3-D-xylosyltransferase MGP4-like n=1 Tax=Acanthaster planci TaxID=133434 RepID=A0A8B7YIV2_ACAPL|nr:UDP-D-xylose:L-fucose alpha-1,3-D-xylosyltransferase MGP4-like [Acanthaster planci]
MRSPVHSKWVANLAPRNEVFSSYYGQREGQTFDTGTNSLYTFCERLLSPRSFCRVTLGMIFFVTIASVALWINKTPLELKQGVPLENLGEVQRRSNVDAQEDAGDNSTEDYAMGYSSLSNQSFAAVVRSLATSLPEKRIVMTTTNKGFLDFTENMLISIQKVGIHPEVVVIAEDVAAYKALLNHSYGLHVLKPPDFTEIPDEKDALAFGVADYVKFINRRPGYVHEFIQQGFEVFFVDSDTFWFNDPFPYFQGDQYDVAFMRDSRRVFNAGVGFYRPTNRTEYFLRLWVWVLDTQPKLRQDQHVLNYILSSKISPDLKVRSLGFQSFPTCKIFYNWEKETCRNATVKTAVFHAAFVPDHVNKRRVFENCNLWLVNK